MVAKTSGNVHDELVGVMKPAGSLISISLRTISLRVGYILLASWCVGFSDVNLKWCSNDTAEVTASSNKVMIATE